MVATLYAETFHGRQTNYDDKAVRRYVRTFIVQTDSALDGPLTVRLASGIPRLTTPYLEPNGLVADLGALCTHIAVVQREDNPNLWDVTCEYSSESERPDRMQDNPIARPTDIYVDYDTYQVPSTHSVTTGKPIVNSAGMPFDPPHMKDDDRLVLVMERNELAPDLNLLASYSNVVNSDPFFGVDPLFWKCKPIRWRRMYENGLYYFRVTYRFAHSGQTDWLFKTWDQGRFVKDTKNPGQLLAIKDTHGIPVTQDVLLDGHGQVLPNNGTPVELDWNEYLPQPFAALNLP